MLKATSTRKNYKQFYCSNSNLYLQVDYEEVEYGNGGSYRQVDYFPPNCIGYALFETRNITITNINNHTSHNSEYYSDMLQEIISDYVTSCRRIASYTSSIASNEYRLAARIPNLYGDGTYRYHVIYQLSDGTWAGKDHSGVSQHFGNKNPSTSPEMWSDDAYHPYSGTIYFAVRK